MVTKIANICYLICAVIVCIFVKIDDLIVCIFAKMFPVCKIGDSLVSTFLGQDTTSMLLIK